MEPEYLKWLRENKPDFYKALQADMTWAAEWRDKRIAELERRVPQPDALAEALKYAATLADLLVKAIAANDPSGELMYRARELQAALAAPRPERTYSAEEVRELVAAFRDAVGAVEWGARTAGPHRVSPDGIEMFLKTLWRIEPVLRCWPSGERKDAGIKDDPPPRPRRRRG